MEITGIGEFPQSMEIEIFKKDNKIYLNISEKHPNIKRTFVCKDVKLHVDHEIIKEFNLC